MTGVLVAAISVLLAPACRRHSKRRVPAPVRHVTAPPQRLVPLRAPKPLDTLELDTFEAASVFIPLGAHWARPVVVALHGKDEAPQTTCEAWSQITDRDAFVVCPSLRARHRDPSDAGVECETVDCLADELRAALVAMRKRFGHYVARNEVALAGHAAGAGRAVPIALQNPSVFSVVWLVNGGFRDWSSALSTTYVERGGKWLGLVCSDASCEADVLRVSVSANAAGLKTAVARPGHFGIAFDARVIQAARQIWAQSKPVTFPWTAPDKSEHPSSPATEPVRSKNAP